MMRAIMMIVHDDDDVNDADDDSIFAGLMRQMTFRKDDGSFGTWPHADSSTWCGGMVC